MGQYFKIDLNEMKLIAESLASQAAKGDVICLIGDLGVGKTSFAKFFIQSFFLEEIAVVSPTFSIVQIYQAENIDIWHFDLYRLETAEELDEIGIEDAINDGISIIEWPKIAKNKLPINYTEVKINFTDNDNYRSVFIDQVMRN